jgi:hypothetical protein
MTQWRIGNIFFAGGLALVLAGCPGESPQRTSDGSWTPYEDGPSATGDQGTTPQPDSGPAAVCGDNTCDATEDCQSCEADCGTCPPKTLTLEPVADSYVDEGSPSQNYGSATELLTDQGPDQQAVFRFTVAGVTGPVYSAKLRLHVTNSSTDGPAVHTSKDSWTENAVTWNNRPQPDGAAIEDLGNVPTGWLEIDVTSVVTSNGAITFLLVPTGSNGCDFNSRESSNKPQLVIETVGGPPPKPDAGVDSGPPVLDGSTGGPTFSFFAVGDTRSNPNIAQMNFQSMSLLDPKAIGVFNSGDLTADGKPSQWQDHVQAVNLGSGGKIRMDLSSWNSAYIRYFGIVGNHDTHESAWLTNWNTYLPGPKNLGHNSSSGIWFSVKYGSALFIVLDSENSAISTQTTWLQQVLQSAAADPAIKWKFAFYHHPVYPCNYKSPWSKGIPWVREFEKYKVDMVFNGHAHVYERTCPMVGGKCQAGGVIYVISGGGGAGTGDVDLTKTATSGTDSYDCSQILPVGKGNWHHYCHIQIDGNKLTYNCYSHNATSAPEDTHTIVK